jgi:hypothetical protein
MLASLEPPRHLDGDGPLASLDGGFESMAVDPQPGVTAWTFGMPLCVHQGTDRATLESVEPTETVGSGFAELGTGVREFTPNPSHQPIISVEAWPPPVSYVPDVLRPVADFDVETQCGNGPDAPYTELLIGLGRVGLEGGGWKGIEVGYVVDGRHRVVALNHNILICGPDIADDCAVPPASPSSNAAP